MPAQTRTPATTATTTPATTAVAPQDATSGNSFRSALVSGLERLDGEASTYFAQGITFQKGMKGELIKRVQQAIGSGQDGGFGAMTEAKLKLFQKANGLAETGVVDQLTWGAIVTKTSTLGNLKGEDDFQRLWDAHPHNYQSDADQNTSSDALVEELGMPAGSVPNTCALRMSTAINRLGDNMKITKGRGQQAGLHKMRANGMYMPGVADPKTKATDDRVIVSAKEMWTYIEKHRGKPDLEFPPRGRYKTQEEAEAGAQACADACAAHKGFVAFDKIYGYGGSGHIDLFNGTLLSDSSSWYASEKIKIWFVVKGVP